MAINTKSTVRLWWYEWLVLRLVQLKNQIEGYTKTNRYKWPLSVEKQSCRPGQKVFSSQLWNVLKHMQSSKKKRGVLIISGGMTASLNTQPWSLLFRCWRGQAMRRTTIRVVPMPTKLKYTTHKRRSSMALACVVNILLWLGSPSIGTSFFTTPPPDQTPQFWMTLRPSYMIFSHITPLQNSRHNGTLSTNVWSPGWWQILGWGRGQAGVYPQGCGDDQDNIYQVCRSIYCLYLLFATACLYIGQNFLGILLIRLFNLWHFTGFEIGGGGCRWLARCGGLGC